MDHCLHFRRPSRRTRHAPAERDDVFNYPWLYAVEVGHWQLTDSQAKKLREYLERGGFFMCHNMDLGDAWKWADWPQYDQNWPSTSQLRLCPSAIGH